MTIADLQKLALSQIVYRDLPSGNSPTGDPWTIRQLLDANYITDASYDEAATPPFTTAVPQLAALSSMLDWTLVKFQSSPDATGYASAAFTTSSGDIVFTFRGTNNPIKSGLYNFFHDLDDDGVISLGNMGIPAQFLEGYSFVKATIEAKENRTFTDTELKAYITSNSTEFTGHSLGGGIAQYLTYLTEGSATTFNAVGIGQIEALNINPQSYGSFNVTDYVTSDDIVGSFGRQLGETVYIQGPLDNTNVNIDAVAEVIRITLAINLTLNFDVALGTAMIASIMATMNSETKAYLAGQVMFGAHDLDQFFDSNGNINTVVSASDALPIIDAIQDRVEDISNLTEGYMNGVTYIHDGLENVSEGVQSVSNGAASYISETSNAATDAVQDLKTGIDTIISTRSSQLNQELVSISSDAAAITSRLDEFFNDIVTDSQEIFLEANTQLNQRISQAINQFDSILDGIDLNELSANIAKRILQGTPPAQATLIELSAFAGQLSSEAGEVIVDAISDSTAIVVDYLEQQIPIIQAHISDAIADIIPSIVDIVGNTVDVAAIVAGGISDSLNLLGSELLDFGAEFTDNLLNFGGSAIDGLVSIAEGLASIRDGLFTYASTTIDAWLSSGAYQQLSSWWSAITGNIASSTNPDASISGTSQNDTIFGYAGDNTIYAQEGNDLVYASSGNDFIYGGAGDDVIRGEQGDDILAGDYVDLYWGTGSGNGKDILDGGSGNDALYGGAGNDTYVFGRGYGQDMVKDYDRPYSYYNPSNGGFDTIKFLHGVSSNDVFIERIGDALKFSILGTNDSITSLGFWGYSAYGVIEQVTFADGTVWDESLIRDKARYIYGTELSENLSGFSDQSDIVTAGAGNDIITTHDGDDFVYAQSGNDTVTGGWGNDTVYGGTGSDVLYGEWEESTGSSWYYIPTNDLLDGGAGNDLLVGASGNDTYVFGRGYGQDVIDDKHRSYNYYSYGSGGELDSISFLADVAPEDIKVHRRNENDLEFSIIGTEDKLTVSNFFSYYGTGIGMVEQVTFADGTIWDQATLLNKARYINEVTHTWDEASTFVGYSSQDDVIEATSANDTIITYDGNDVVHAGAGNDTATGGWGADSLHGGAGDDSLYGEAEDSTGAIWYYVPTNDTLDGGAGNDLLVGSGGDDTYVFGRGYGQDTIDDRTRSYNYNHYGSGGSLDTISFLADVSPADITVARQNNNDLEFRINGTTDKITVRDFFSYYNTGIGMIEQVTFADGTVWDQAAILDKARLIEGTSADETIYGYDHIADIIDGGVGNDILEGRRGNDTYLFNIGSGNDTIYDSDSTEGNRDKIIFGSAISQEDVSLQRDGDNLVFTFTGSTDTLTIERYFSGYARPSGWSQSYIGINGNKIEQIQFADGTVWDNGVIIEKFSHILGTADSDSLVGIEGQQSKLSGLDGDDTLTATSHGDYLDGGAGDDILNGSYGQDILKGGTGSDSLIGGSGSDTYVFATGDGHDTIYDGDTSYAVDAISFAEGIDPSDVEMTRSSNDLVLKVNGGTDDSITIQSYFSGVLQGSGYEYGVGVNKIERIIFADGTIWHTASLEDQFRYITGTTSDDTLNGYETDDVITAQEGNDTVHAGIGNDTVDAGEGNDIIYSEAGNDQLIGGAGNDTLNGGIGNDVIDGGTDNDVLVGNEGSDTYIFRLGDGTDEISDSSVNAGEVDVIAFQSGVSPQDVTLQRSGDDLVLTTTNAADSLTVKGYFSAYREGDPTEYGVGVNKIEQVTFTDGTVWNSRTIEYAVSSNNGAVDPNVTFGTSQSDGLYADQDGQTIYAGEGDDSIAGQVSNDILYGEVGNDTIHAGQGNDTLVGGAGNDHLHGEEGSDTYLFTPGFGHDTIADYDTTQGNIDTIAFSSEIAPGDITLSRVGNNLILASAAGDSITIQSYFAGAVSGHHKIEQVTFADGTVWDTTFLETATPSTSTYDNTVVGSEYNDYLYGTSGNDAISGRAGSDTVYSDNGVYDGIGNDLLDGGTGNDTLYGAGGDDTYVFGLGYGQDYLLDESRSGTGAYIDGGYDTLKIMPGVTPEDIVVRRSGVDMIIEIASTSDSITIGAFFREIEGVYTSGIERVQFSDPNQTVWTLEDLVYKAQNIEGTSGNETLYGYEGQDNILKGVAGDDTLYGASGNDTLDGGTGNDMLQGGYGSDTYIFGIGYGVDTIDDSDSATNNQDTIQFLEGVTPQDVHVTRSGDRLELSIIGTEDKLIVERYFSPYNRNGYYTGSEDGNKIERVQFADGTTWSIADIKDKARHINGTVNDDTLYGYGDQQNVITAGDGNDTVYAGGLGDQLDGGSENDLVFGSSGNDTLVGGTGNDQLEGNSGNDKYIFAPGFGNDTIYDIDSLEGNIDTIQFLEGISPEDVVATRSGENLVLTIIGSTDSLTIDRYFSHYTRNGYYAGSPDAQKVELIEFADGTTWSIAGIKEKVRHMSGTENGETIYGFGDQQNIITAGDGDDTVYAGGFGDNIHGGAGNDTLYGSSGNDTLTGDTGSDQLEGSYGNDKYTLAPGFGNDTVYDIDSSEGNIDTIQFLEGISPADITAARIGDDLVLTVAGTSDTLTIDQYFSQYTRNGYYAGGPDAQKVEVIEFADGTTWSIADIKEKVRHMSGTAGDDIISGFGDQQNIIAAGAGNDTIYASYQGDEISGEEGNDTIFGSSASDTLNGGAGNDTLEGSSGNDSYVYSLGDGNDTIYDTDSTEGNVDNVTFLEGISPADVTVKRAGDNLELSFTGTSDKLTIERYFSAYPRYGYYSVGENGNKIEEFRFANGTVWDIAAIKEKVRHISGTSSDDVISGFGDQQNIIAAGDGNDVIYASYQGDSAKAEAGNDTIYGSSGNDLIDGGTGNDTLEGLTGNDTYTFKLGDGQDVIYDTDQGQGSSIDVVEFGEGVNASDVIAKRLQNEDLELTNAVTGDKLIIERYFSGYYKNSSWYTGADSNKIEEFRFADGTVWDIAAIREKVREISGTDNADSISGFGDQKNTISGKEGDDNLYAASLGDALYGNEGNDNLYGSAGEDTLVGGSGNDRLEGLTGNDTYVFALGDGQDVIYDTDHGQGGTIDAVSFLEGINPADVSIKRLSNDDLEIAIAGTSDKLTIERYFSSYYKNSSWSTGVNSNAIEEFRFADGTIWDIAPIKDKAQYITGTEYSDTLSGFGDQQNTIIGGDGDDYLYAGYQGDSLYGDAGNDTIYGNSGNDHLRGGIGNDRLEGSTGNDTYAFNLGDGQDVIYDTDHGQGGSLDVVQFGDGITASNIKVKRLSNDDLEIQVVGTDDKLTVERYFSDYYRNSSWNTGVDSNTIEEFRFNDGTYLDRYSIDYFLNMVDGTELSDVLHGNDAANTITGFAGDDSIYAAGGHDILYGNDGNDYLSGGADSDLLMGGAGNDILEGGADDDIYTVNAGGGIDTIYDSHGSHDLLQITLDKNSLIFNHSGNDLKVLVGGASDEVIVGDWNVNGNDTIEEILAVDGSTITSTQINQLIQAMATFSSENNGMSWSQALQDRPNDVQAILAQHWTAPTA